MKRDPLHKMPPKNGYLSLLRELILNEFKNEKIKVVLFGSRARGDQSSTSDIDIGLLPSKEIDTNKLTLLRERIEKLNIPYKIDLVNLFETDEAFRKEVLKDAVIWKE